MADEPERITILASEFTTAALEFHRGKMAERGYRLDGTITPYVFQKIEGMGRPEPLFDGKPMFAATFRKAPKE